MIRFVLRSATAGAVLLMTVAAMSPGGVAPPTAPNMVALRQLEKGQWELRERDRAPRPSTAPRRICVSDPAQLLQVRHGNSTCNKFVIADAPNRAVVSYQCNGAGKGRTDLRVETPRLVQIDAQGVADGAPFALSLEGRRTGNCP